MAGESVPRIEGRAPGCGTAARLPDGLPRVVPEAALAFRRIVRAMAARKRYRYVRPEVRRASVGFVVVCPCCSRNVDPVGGVIDIAWIEPVATGWRLHNRDHAAQRWEVHAEGTLPKLLDLLCADPDRRFWP
jgi:hypothetical protein